MGKRNKNKTKPWILLHEIYLPLNRSRSQEDRCDVVTLARMNQNGKVLHSKKIPEGMIRFYEGDEDGERHLHIDSEFLYEFESIQTIRHFIDPRTTGIVGAEHAIIA